MLITSVHSVTTGSVTLPSDKANRDIDLLVNQEGNSVCSECGKQGMVLQKLATNRLTYFVVFTCRPEPTWASLEYGVFICVHCSGVFRTLSNSNLRAIRLEDWDDHGVQVVSYIAT